MKRRPINSQDMALAWIEEPEVIRHERALDELLWAILVYLVDPHAVVTVGEPRDKEIEHGN